MIDEGTENEEEQHQPSVDEASADVDMTKPDGPSHYPCRPSETCVSESTNQDDYYAAIHPPPSRIELFRDHVLEMLTGDVFHWIALAVIIMVVVDGALFFFLLIGAHNMCDTPSRFDCDPRNYWYNFAIQFLNVNFTYLATVSFPWKLSHAIHLTCSRRLCQIGLDLYGQPTEEIWFHICPKKRRMIVALLVVNSLAQYVNQVTRIVYYNFELQNTFPGNLWTNVFFLMSFSCAIIAGIRQLYLEAAVRKEQPNRFPPGPVAIAKQYVRSIMRPDASNKGSGVSGAAEDLEDPKPFPIREEKERKRCFRGVRRWLKTDKTSLDMWGF